jgi:hypothetical protein
MAHSSTGKPEISPEALFVQVLKDMEPYKDNVILVGGWLPFIYTHFVWKNPGTARIMATTDIDYAVRENFGFKGIPLAEMFSHKAIYTKQRVYEKEAEPFGYTVVNGELKMKIDLISHELMDPKLIENVAGHGVDVAPMGYTEILLDKTSLMRADVTVGKLSAQVTIPVPAAYLYLKGLACAERDVKGKDGEYKFKKDLWSVYYVAEYIPEADKKVFYAKLKGYKSQDPEMFNHFCDNLTKYFKTEVSRGPKGIEELALLPGSFEKGFLRKRTVEVVKNLLAKIK